MQQTNSTPSRFASLLLLTCLLCAAHPAPGATAAAAQGHQRERRVATPRATPTPAPSQTPASKQTPTPTPSQTPSPARTPAPSLRVGPMPAQTPAPTPAAQTPTPAPTPASTETLEELRARIRDVLSRPEFASSHMAVKVASLDTGRVLFEENARKWMQPASNLKLYTVAAALDRLSPDYRFITSVYAPARPDQTGTVRGDLVVYGRGDPSFATRFNGDDSGDYYRAMNELASRIYDAGVRRVEGELVGDESYFTGSALAPGWEWDDLQWWYGAEVSALSVNDNSVDLTVKPGARVGDPAVITIGPATSLLTVVDRTSTTPRGSTRELVVHRPLGRNVLEIRGTLPVDDRGFTASVAVSNPAMMFALMLRQALERRGVVITGGTRTVDAQTRSAQPLEVSSLVELATRQSPPLSVIAAQTMKPSQNLYTELLLRTIGKVSATDPRKTTADAGIEAVKNFLKRAGIDDSRLIMLDGSGLSRGNLVTADTTLQLLIHMNRHRYSAAFRDTLPIAGVDGTLRNRMRGTPAMNNARAKTGTLSSATTLSGYVFSAAGERLVYSLMINNPPRDADPRAGFTDAITVLLASFNGRS